MDDILKNIPENLDAGIFVLGADGRVLYVNSSAIQLMGRPKSELLSYDTSRAYQAGLIDTHIFQEVLRTKKPVTRFQSFCRRDSGYSQPLLVTQTPVLDSNSELKYSVGIVQDTAYLMRKIKQAEGQAVSTFAAPGGPPVPSNFIYASDRMGRLVQRAAQVAKSDATMLIQGESGTGKEVMAQFIHSQSRRKGKEIVAVNCAALPENLLEAELFGYEKGAFTGALKEGKPGLVEQADHGTLFLDEIDSLPLALQGKLLRVLESREVRRLGSVTSRQVDFRLLAATNADLHSRIEQKQFRADLFYRINVVPLVIPPLRERKEDIPLLCEGFFARYEQKYGMRKQFSPKAYEALLDYDWPGNVRELKNFVERIVLLTDVTVSVIDQISPELLTSSGEAVDMPFGPSAPSQELTPTFSGTYDETCSLKEAVHRYEQWTIREAVRIHGSYSKAAAALSIDKSTLIRKLR